MKRYVTRPFALKISNFSVAILFCMLSFNGTRAIATTITSDAAINVKLTSATLGATITPPESVILDRGFFWSTVSPVTTADQMVSEHGTLGGSFTVNVTGLVRSKTIYFKSYYKEADGTFILSTEKSFSNVPVFSGNGNWIDVARWNVQEIPGFAVGDSVVIDGNCVTDNLTINAGAKLTIKAGKVLNVTGTIINNAGVAGLILKSDGILPNATLTYVTGTPVATVEMYSKANWDLNQADGNKFSWQFFGVPVKSFTMTPDFLDCLIRKYDASATVDIDLWKNQTPSMPLTSGAGYEVVQQKSIIYRFTGELTNENFVQPVTYTLGTSYPGQQLFSNPYTAAIDITKIVFDANTESAVYLFNTGTYNQWFDIGNNPDDGTSTPGQFTVSTPITAGSNGVPAQIPGMQGFLVKTMAQTSGVLSIPYATTVGVNSELQRSKEFSKKGISDKVSTRIDLSGSHIADNMWIFTDSKCSTGFDNGWDGYKMKGSVSTPQLYAVEAQGDFQIDAVADINGTFLGFNPGQETDYTLTFTHQNTDTRYSGLYLVDLVTNTTTDITASGSVYAFTAASTPTTTKRFKIVTSPEVNTSVPGVLSKLSVFNSKGSIYVQNKSSQNGSLVLYTMNGVAVKRVEFESNKVSSFSTSGLIPGTYVVKACTSQDMVTERIIIR